jgi:SAM-dependent methyltransferase
MNEPDRATAIHSAAAEGFSRGAQAYVRGRPDYPPQTRAWLLEDLGLRAGKVVLDLGAGTGKFTRTLLATGASVIAVDPVPQMLEQLAQAAPGAKAMVGAAEHIPAADSTVDAVVCAQAFHWFATGAALAEIRRVLKPGGVLGLIWNVRDESVEWVAALTALLVPYEDDTPRYSTGRWRKLFPAEGFGPLREQSFPHGHTGPTQQVILDRVSSISFIAALDAPERARLLTQVERLIETTPELAGRDEVTFPYVTAAHHLVRTSSSY